MNLEERPEDITVNPEQKPEDKPQEPKRLQGLIDMMIGNLAHWNDDPEEYDRRKFEQESSLKLNKDGKIIEDETDEKPATDKPSQ